jgi:hypothetical protein
LAQAAIDGRRLKHNKASKIGRELTEGKEDSSIRVAAVEAPQEQNPYSLSGRLNQ